MKKICFFLIFILCFAAFHSYALGISGLLENSFTEEEPSAPDRRDVFYFVEEYSKRWMENKPEDKKFRPQEYYYNDIAPYRVDGYISINCAAGDLLINKENFTVAEYSNILYYLGGEEWETKWNESIFYDIAVAISVLEYNSIDAELLRMLGQSPVIETMKTITPAIRENLDWERLITKDGEIIIHKGNYIYSLDYFESNEGTKMLWLLAK